MPSAKEKLRSGLLSAHRTAVLAATRDATSTPELLRNLQHTMRVLPALAAREAEKHLDDVFKQGFRQGAKDSRSTSPAPDEGDLHSFEWMKTNPLGFLTSVGNLGQSEMDWYSRNLADLPLDEAKKATKQRLQDAAYKIDQIVRTSDQKAVTLGRLLSWIDDQYRDFYNYYWVPVHDSRTKDVSLLFERRNPMTYWQLRKTFEVDHVTPKMVTNRRTGRREAQISAINCRCKVARAPKSRRQLISDGLISQTEAA